jgi:hypothetical protein
MNVEKAIKYELSMWVDSDQLKVESAKDINNGWCDEFAKSVKDTLSNPVDLSIYSYGFDSNGYTSHAHKWIFYDGKHYDAECPEGVKNPSKLPIFQRSDINPNST